MPRASANKLYRTFVKGLITEASALTYPEDATLDEDNCIIHRKGNRTRRYGVDYEDGSTLSPHTVLMSQLSRTAKTEYVWESVASKSTLNFLVNQIGTTLYFYSVSETPISSGLKPFTVSLLPYVVNSSFVADLGTHPVQMSSGKGFLFISGQYINPILVSYDPDTSVLTSEQITIQIRDFKGVNDGLSNDQEPTTLSDAHKYNLRNQGWLDPSNDASGSSVTTYSHFGGLLIANEAADTPIGSYYAATGRYPGNNKQWWVAKDATTNVFSPAKLKTEYFGTGRAPRGHYIVDAFNIDRTAVSGVTGLPAETTDGRPTAVAFFAGRVWYLESDTIYFTQVLDDKRRVGMCYQEADPTAETINDLIATDGGVVPIPEIGRGVRLVPVGSGLLVFAVNGVWAISGTQAGFSARDYQVQKLSSIGTEAPYSIVETTDKLYYWSKAGIQSLQMGEGGTKLYNETERTIQTFYNESVASDAHPYVKGIYDTNTNVIQWLFRGAGTEGAWTYDRVLNFDRTLGAFYPWSIDVGSGPLVTGIFNSTYTSLSKHQGSFTKVLCAVPDITTYNFAIALFDSDRFCDWYTFNRIGHPYLSYAETGHELLEDAMRKKEANYVFLYFRQTEGSFVATADGGFALDRPSSCYFQARWDWSTSSISNRWSSRIQGYRLSRAPFVNVEDLSLDTGYSVVVTKNKVRGNGKSVRYRFENGDIGSDFDLLGWAVAYSGNTTV